MQEKYKRIITAEDERTRIVAGPGTGKTYAVMQRIAYLLKSGTNPEKILLLTFSKTSAKDLVSEIEKLDVEGASNITACTLHSFCYKTLLKSGVFEMTGRITRILFDFEVKFLEEDLKLVLNTTIKNVRQELKAFQAGWARLQNELPGWPLDRDDRDFDACLLQWLKFHKSLLIGEVVKETLKYLRENPLAEERQAFDYIFVDEYQDLNRAEQELVRILSQNSHLMILGDEDQSIYEGFRYAHPEGILKFHESHENTVDIQLDECRRCPQKIVDIANYFIQHNQKRDNTKKLIAHSDNKKGEVFKLQWHDLEEEALGIAEYIKHCISSNRFRIGRILVLCPRRHIGGIIKKKLNDFDIEAYSFFNEDILTGNPKKEGEAIAQEALTLLSLAANPSDPVALRCWIGFNHSSLNSRLYDRLRSYCENNSTDVFSLLNNLCTGKVTLKRIGDLVDRFIRLQKLLAEINNLKGVELIDRLFPLNEENWAIPIRATLKKDIHSYDVESLHKELKENLVANESPTNVNYVRIMSLHSSKGLTADLVIICGFIDSLIPYQDFDLSVHDQQSMVEEQRRLFYVGLTRSTDTLIVSSVKSIPRSDAYRMGATVSSGFINRTFPSPFIHDMGVHVPETLDGNLWLNQQLSKVETDVTPKADYLKPEKKESVVTDRTSTIGIFISYAHAHKDVFKIFKEDFKSYTKNLTYASIEIYTDENIPLGAEWHENIQEAVSIADIAILLLSDKFMTSEYIRKHEVENFLKRNKEDGILVVPIYFYPCRFQDWPFLSKYQFFKPNGDSYERADKGDRFCYAHLIEFDMLKGVKLPKPNPNRAEYMMDFVDALEPRFKELSE